MKRVVILFFLLISNSLFSADWTLFYKDPEGLENYGMDYYYDKSNVIKTKEGYKKVDILVNLKKSSHLELNNLLDCVHNKYMTLNNSQMYDAPFASGSSTEYSDPYINRWQDGTFQINRLIKTVCSNKERPPGVKIGDKADFVINKSSWGKPKEIHRTTTSHGTHEQWVYGDGNYLYIDNGIVTAIQN